MRYNRPRIVGLRHEMDYKLLVWIVVLVVSASAVLIGGQSCPALMCKCKWTNGKETAFCDNRTLSEIPIGIPVSTQVLDLSLNQLTRLGPQVFRERGLINLQKIFMSKCKLGNQSIGLATLSTRSSPHEPHSYEYMLLDTNQSSLVVFVARIHRQNLSSSDTPDTYRWPDTIRYSFKGNRLQQVDVNRHKKICNMSNLT